jgi:hypothetical protein
MTRGVSDDEMPNHQREKTDLPFFMIVSTSAFDKRMASRASFARKFRLVSRAGAGLGRAQDGDLSKAGEAQRSSSLLGVVQVLAAGGCSQQGCSAAGRETAAEACDSAMDGPRQRARRDRPVCRARSSLFRLSLHSLHTSTMGGSKDKPNYEARTPRLRSLASLLWFVAPRSHRRLAAFSQDLTAEMAKTMTCSELASKFGATEAGVKGAWPRSRRPFVNSRRRAGGSPLTRARASCDEPPRHHQVQGHEEGGQGLGADLASQTERGRRQRRQGEQR